MRRIAVLLANVLLTIAATEANAQVSFTARALGLGGAALGVARGQEAIFANPANLGLPDSPRWSVGVLQLNISGLMEGLEVSDISDLIEHGDLSDEERDRLFADVPAAGIDFAYDLRSSLASIQVGQIGVGLSFSSIGDHSLSRDLVELFLYGYEEGRTDYDVENTDGFRAGYWDAAIGYGATSGPFTLGITGHYLRGTSIVRSFADDPQIDLIQRDIRVGYTGVSVEGGSGMAIDLGVAAQLLSGLTIGASVANAYARMDWSDELRVRNITLDRADFDDGDLLDILEEYEDSERPVEAGDAGLTRGMTALSLRDEIHLPTIVTVGGAWTAPSRTTLAASLRARATDGLLSGPWSKQFSVGVEQRIPIITLRAGYANDFDGSSLISGGLHLGPLDVGVAKRDDSPVSGGTRSGWIAMFGLSVSGGTPR